MADNSIFTQAGGGFTGQSEGPFQNIINSGLIPGSQPLPQPSGFMNKTGKIAYFADALLQGMQRGRMLSYMSQEAQKTQQFKGAIALLESRKNQEGLSQEQIAQINKMEGDVYAQYYNAVSGDQEQPKKRKGGNNSNNNSAAGGPIGAIKNTIGSIFQSLGGGGTKLPESGQVDLNQIRGNLDKLGVPDLSDRIDKSLATMQGIRKGLEANGPVTTDELWSNKDFRDAYARIQREFPNKPQLAEQYLTPVLAGLYNRPEQQKIDIAQQELDGQKAGESAMYGGPSVSPPSRPPQLTGGALPTGGSVPPMPTAMAQRPQPQAQVREDPENRGYFAPSGTSGPSIPGIYTGTPKETIPRNPLSAYYKKDSFVLPASAHTYYQREYGFTPGQTTYLTSPDGTRTVEAIQMTPNEAPRFVDPDQPGREVNVAAMKAAGWTASRKDPSTEAGREVWADDPKDPTRQISYLVKGNGKPIQQIVDGQPVTRLKPERQTELQRRVDRNDDNLSRELGRAVDWRSSELVNRVAAINNNANLPPEEKQKAITDVRSDVEQQYKDRVSAYKELAQQEEDRINGKFGKPLSEHARQTIAEENKNPGNIRDTVTGEFKSYSSYEEGWADLERQAQFKLDGRDSRIPKDGNIMDFAKVWAPPSENDTAAWAKKAAAWLSKVTGKPVTPASPLSQFKGNAANFADAISYAEGTNGKIPRQTPLPAGVDITPAIKPGEPLVTFSWGH